MCVCVYVCVCAYRLALNPSGERGACIDECHTSGRISLIFFSLNSDALFSLRVCVCARLRVCVCFVNPRHRSWASLHGGGPLGVGSAEALQTFHVLSLRTTFTHDDPRDLRALLLSSNISRSDSYAARFSLPTHTLDIYFFPPI